MRCGPVDWEPFVAWLSFFVLCFAIVATVSLMYSPGLAGVGLIVLTLGVAAGGLGIRARRMRT